MPEINAAFRKEQRNCLKKVHECKENFENLIKETKIEVPKGKFQREEGEYFSYKLNFCRKHLAEFMALPICKERKNNFAKKYRREPNAQELAEILKASRKTAEKTQMYLNAKSKLAEIDEIFIENRNELVEHEHLLVRSIAGKILHKGVELAELIQMGKTGLMKAVENFDFNSGHQFSTYATWWIRQSIGRGITDGGEVGDNIRTPVHIHGIISKYKKEKDKFLKEYGRKPNVYELAERLKKSPEEIERIQRNIAVLPKGASLDIKIGEDEESTLHDFIRSDKDKEPDFLNEKDQLKAMVDKCLTTREKGIIMLRFGLGVGYPRTLEEVGKIFKITRERVRQIEKKAIGKLQRHKDRIGKLGTYNVVAETAKSNQKRYYYADKVAKRLKMKYYDLVKEIKKGKIEAEKVSYYYKIPSDEVERIEGEILSERAQEHEDYMTNFLTPAQAAEKTGRKTGDVYFGIKKYKIKTKIDKEDNRKILIPLKEFSKLEYFLNGYLILKEEIKKLGMSTTNVLKKINKEGIKTEREKTGYHKILISSEEMSKLKEKLQNVREGYLTIKQVTEKTGMSAPGIYSRIKKIEIKTEKEGRRILISENELERLIEDKQKIKEGLISIEELSKETGIRKNTLFYRIKTEGIKVKREKGGHHRILIPIEDIIKLKEKPRKEAKEGYLTIKQAAEIMGESIPVAYYNVKYIGIKTEKKGGRILIPEAEIEKLKYGNADKAITKYLKIIGHYPDDYKKEALKRGISRLQEILEQPVGEADNTEKPADKEHLSIYEASKILGKSYGNVRYKTISGEIKSEKQGKHVLIPIGEIERIKSIQRNYAEKYVTTKEFAEKLGKKAVSIYNLIVKGKIKAEKYGKDYRIPMEEFKRFEKENTHNKENCISLKEFCKKIGIEYVTSRRWIYLKKLETRKNYGRILVPKEEFERFEAGIARMKQEKGKIYLTGKMMEKYFPARAT